MLYFLDIETTGLDDQNDEILEVACIQVSGTQIKGRPFNWAIQPPVGWKTKMNDYVTDMHDKSGLTNVIDTVKNLPTLATAEAMLLDWFGPPNGPEKPIIAGFSIHFDRRFIRAQMPKLNGFLHYRMLDVSSLKIFVRNNWPSLVPERKTEPAHRALQDAMESLQTYRHYIDNLNPRKWAVR